MQKAAVTSRFLIGDSSKAGFADSEIVVSCGGLIQHIVTSHLVHTVRSREALYKLNNALIHFAEHAYTLRDIDALEEVSSVLMNLPLDAARIVGLYYHALASQRSGQINEAKTLFETVADNAPITYRARALQSLGINHHTRYELDEALRFQLEALRAASDKNADGLQTILLAHLETSHVKSDTGDHKGALAILEGIAPLVRLVATQNPLYFYFYHNELAVEFGELNRIAEAEAASAIALASSFAPAYPEWSETRQELEAKRTSATPSVVAINRAPEASPSQAAGPERKTAPVNALALSGHAFKEKSVQIPIVLIAGAAALNRIGITQVILYCLRKCVRARGPPALLQETFRALSESVVESTEKKARVEQNQFAIQFSCAQSYCLIVAISVRVLDCCRNYTGRSPPLRSDAESEAGLLNRLAATSSGHCFKASNHQHFQPGSVHRPEVNPHSKLRRFQKIWAAAVCATACPPSPHTVVWKELPLTNTGACRRLIRQ